MLLVSKCDCPRMAALAIDMGDGDSALPEGTDDPMVVEGTMGRHASVNCDDPESDLSDVVHIDSTGCEAADECPGLSGMTAETTLMFVNDARAAEGDWHGEASTFATE